ncbi:hypothetical protein RB195_000193 [Necator americanus]|uniref:Uncharacterized protein n=1 Tax=Necator americanus TaxID=51031 RepID=A0ABR1D8F0_NECAM
MVEGAHDRLYLSPEETIFLSIFHEEQKSFDTRVVHCGVGSFPVMSLVLAFDANIYLFVGMNRVLTNIRKGFDNIECDRTKRHSVYFDVDINDDVERKMNELKAKSCRVFMPKKRRKMGCL